jgi:hypothetical protein
MYSSGRQRRYRHAVRWSACTEQRFEHVKTGGVEGWQLQPPLHRSARMCARWRIVWGALSFCKTNLEINGFAFEIPRRSWAHAQFGSAFNNRIGNLERTTHPTNKTAREFRAVHGFDVRTLLICNHDPGFPQVLDDTLTKTRPLRLAGRECDDAGRTLLDRSTGIKLP